MAKCAHTNIRVLDEERSVSFYEKALGFKVFDKLDFDDFSLTFLTGEDSDFELELTVNKGREEAYTHGTGYGHLAVTVGDLDAEHSRCEGLNLDPTPIKELYTGEKLAVRFFFLNDPDGYKVEIVQRQGRYR